MRRLQNRSRDARGKAWSEGSREVTHREGFMIRFLANLLRGLHFVIGITAPPPEHNERLFVFAWLGVIAIILGCYAFLLYLIPFHYFRH